MSVIALAIALSASGCDPFVSKSTSGDYPRVRSVAPREGPLARALEYPASLVGTEVRLTAAIQALYATSGHRLPPDLPCDLTAPGGCEHRVMLETEDLTRCYLLEVRVYLGRDGLPAARTPSAVDVPQVQCPRR